MGIMARTIHSIYHHCSCAAWRQVLTAGCIGVLAACANSQYTVNWQAGAKHAWITEIIPPDTPDADLPPCLASLPHEMRQQNRYVKVRYWRVRVPVIEVAAVPSGAAVQPGQNVELYPADCAAGKLSRIARVFPMAQ
jgi:hypothetical protein